MITTATAAAASRGAKIYSSASPAVIVIRSEGQLFSGEQDTTAGSGFIVSPDGLALTARHLTLDPANYKSVTTQIQIGSRDAGWQSAAVVSTGGEDADFAIIRIEGQRGLPFLPLGSSANASIGDDLFVLGFPLTYGLYFNHGLLSAQMKPVVWAMDAAVNPGSSGGPVLDENGQVIGITSSGAVWANVKGVGQVPVHGINFFVPIDFATKAAAKAIRESLPNGGRPSDVTFQAGVAAPLEIARAYSISVMKDDHPVLLEPDGRDYVQHFEAESGYRIVRNEVVVNSANKLVSGPQVEVAEGGAGFDVRFTLESGPILDQWRGWLDANVLTQQVRHDE